MRRLSVILGILSTASLMFAQQRPDASAIAGNWHLIGIAGDDVHVPGHRTDLRFTMSSGELKGAILSRNDGSEIPLASAEFDGSTLRFQMEAPHGKTQADMPTMAMVRTGARFEGYWTNSTGAPTGPKLKLVRPTF